MTDPMPHAGAAAPSAAAQPFKLALTLADRDLARSIAGAVQDLIEPPPQALTLFEEPAAGEPQGGTVSDGRASGGWRIEAYFDEPTDAARLTADVAAILGHEVPPFRAEDVPDLNWVTISQAALPPVVAGRFTVHGSHDRGRVPRGPGSIVIDAGEAFGTAHHATTYGCLAAIDRLTRLHQFRHVLDLGCGSGVLAIAVARAQPHTRSITATDLDAQSVTVARTNMAINGVARRIAAHAAAGLEHPALRGRRFDLVIANILAAPLIELAPSLARALAPRGRLVLSGLLVPQAPEVTAAYRASGLALVSHDRIAGWSTLVLRRR